MKVESVKKQKVCDVEHGTVFMFDDKHYMKISTSQNNAVNLEEGILAFFQPNIVVTVYPNATLKIN